MKQGALMAALAGLVLMGGTAEAKKPDEKKGKPNLERTVKFERSPIIKHLPITKDTADTNGFGWPIHRSRLGFNVNYTSYDVNGIEYANGVSLNVDGTVNFNALKWLNLRSTLDLNYQSLGLITENASETTLNTNLTLEGRTKLYFSRDLRVFLGAGIDYTMESDKLIYHGVDGNADRHAAGPMLSLGIESRYIDAYISGSVLFGEKSSSYDRDRGILMQHVNLTLVPRYWRFEMPISVDGYRWSINDYLVDRENFSYRFKIEPTFRITPRFYISLFASYLFNDGEDKFSLLTLGGGGGWEFW